MTDDRSAALLIRVWLEGESDEFRARLTAVAPGDGQDAPRDLTVALASSPRDVLEAVSHWLGDFLHHESDLD